MHTLLMGGKRVLLSLPHKRQCTFPSFTGDGFRGLLSKREWVGASRRLGSILDQFQNGFHLEVGAVW